MALRDMSIERIVWDDAADTATLTLRETAALPPPTVAGASSWWPGLGASVTVTVPIKRSATVTRPTGILVTPGTESGSVVYTRYEHDGTAWVAVGRVNADGTPWVG